MYDCVFWDLHLRIPFNYFTIDVLRILNVDPSQFYPNGWVAIEAFRALCLYTFVKVTPTLFLNYFCCHPKEMAGWVSLARIASCPLFCQDNHTANYWEEPFSRFYKEVVVFILLQQVCYD